MRKVLTQRAQSMFSAGNLSLLNSVSRLSFPENQRVHLHAGNVSIKFNAQNRMNGTQGRPVPLAPISFATVATSHEWEYRE